MTPPPSLAPRTVAVIGAVCLVAGWLLASTLTPPIATTQARPDGATRPAAPVGNPTTVSPLLERRATAPTPPTPGRNPFSFAGGRRREAAPDGGGRIDIEAPPAFAPSLPPVGPIYTLAGIGIAGETKTAILTDGQDVMILKVGDRLGPFAVRAIDEMSATLVNDAGDQQVLRLRQ